MKNIVENNKIIAEFLDWEFDDLSETFETPFLKLVEPQAFGNEQFSCKLQDFELDFYTDWNWLMKVVEKCLVGEAEYDEDEAKKAIHEIYESLCNINISSVYNACVKFIKWHNEQKQSS